MPAILVVLLVCLAHSPPAEAGDAGRPTAHRHVLADYRGDWFTVPTAINNRGEIAGWAESADGVSVAFVRTAKGRYRTIARWGAPTDINNHGLVVGLRYPCTGAECWVEGFVWSAGDGTQNLGAFLPFAINDKGDMAGVCAIERQACVLRGGIVTPIAGPGSEALGINERGDVVGTYGDKRAFLLSSEWEFIDLGRAVANDINDKGVIAGHRWKQMGERGERAVMTIWTADRTRTPVGDVSLGVAINKRGWVIANAWDENERSYSFAWNLVTGARVLVSGDGDEYVQLEDINDHGEIVGTAGTHAAVWLIARK